MVGLSSDMDIIYMTYCSEPDTESETGRRSEEITMEMIAAGVEAYWEFDPAVDEPEALVFAILSRGRRASRTRE